MKKLNIFVTVLAIGLAVLFASCDPTTGLDNISTDDLNISWAKGTWSGTSKFEDKVNNSKKTDDVTIEITGTLSVGYGIFAAAAASGNLYANMLKTQVVYYTYTKDKDGKTTSKTTVRLTKK